MSASARSSRLLLALLLVAAPLVGIPVEAHAATVTDIVFNNVSSSADLNSDPTSWAQVDDVTVDAGGTLFLPASASAATLEGWVVLDDGTHEPFAPDDYTLEESGTTGDYTLTLTRPDAATPITVRQSATVPSMFITTGSGLAAIEADKEFEDEGATMAMVDASAATTYNNALSEMKGRGNSTWAFPKKPYQIKLPTSTELVTGAGASKTWILLANYIDASLIRNEVAYNLEGSALADAGEIDFSIKGRMIDLFIDGGFRGSYYLTEKVQVGATRVAITDLEKANATANPDISTYDPVVVNSLAGAPGIQEAGYVPFPNTPAGFENSGYLLELDFARGSRAEHSYVITKYGTPFTVKGPEDANAAEVAFVGNYLQSLESAIYSETGMNSAGTHYSELLDVPSMARYYVIQEMLANDDGFKSSTYFYMDKGGKLKTAPVWDCDRTLGALISAPDPTRVHVGDPTRLAPQWISQLLAHDDFREAVKQQYTDVIAPALDEILAPVTGKLAIYGNEVERSAVLNRLRWPAHSQTVAYATPAQDVAYLRSYLTQRNDAMADFFGPTYATGGMVPSGYFTIGNRSLTLDVKSSLFTSGANIQLWTPNSTGAQTFRIKRGADSLYTITNTNSLKAMTVADLTPVAGSNVQQSTASTSKAQKWRINTYDGHNYTFVSALGIASIYDVGTPSGYVLNAAGTLRGTNVNVLRSNNLPAQRFTLTSVDLGTAPANGSTYAIASTLNTTKVVDVARSSSLDKANIQLWSSNGSSAQRFTVKSSGSGTVELWTGTGGTGVVTVAGHSAINGTNVWQYHSNGSTTQRWTIRPTGDLDKSFYIVSKATGLYVEVANSATASGTNIWVYKGKSTKAQKFLFKKLS